MGPRSYPARASAVFLAGTTLWHGVPCAGANLLASHNWASEGLDMARNDPSVCNCSGNNSAIPDLSALDSNVSSSYGTSCAAWDQAAKYCSGSSVEAWCGEPWCYVNKQCYDKNPDLRPILYKSVYAAGYYYSYFICNTSKALPALKDEANGKLQACGGSAAGLSNGLWSSDVCVRKGEYCKKMMFNAGVCTDTAAGYVAIGAFTSATLSSLGLANGIKPCKAGTFAPMHNSPTCFDCDTGQYQKNPGSQACQCSNPGYHVPARGASSSNPCLAGSYNNHTCASVCKLCEVGRTQSLQHAPACVDCGRGRVMPRNGSSAAHCDSCTPGSYANQTAMSVCTACGTGQYTSQHGSYGCMCSRAGYVPNAQMSGVVGCGPGSYMDKDCGSVCKQCEAGKIAFSNISNAQCSCSPAGYMPDKTRSKNQACVPGTYSNKNCSMECTKCERGRTQGGYHAGYCVPCGLGTEMPRLGSGRDHCDSCKVGHYQDEFGQPECKACQKGKFTEVINSANCTRCLKGYFNDEVGQSQCKVCPPGFYTDAPQAEEPIYCGWTYYSKGHNAKGEGGTECGPCMVPDKLFGIGAEGFNMMDPMQYKEHQCVLTAWLISFVALILVMCFIRQFKETFCCCGNKKKFEKTMARQLANKEKENEQEQAARKKAKRKKREMVGLEGSESDDSSSDSSESEDEGRRRPTKTYDVSSDDEYNQAQQVHKHGRHSHGHHGHKHRNGHHDHGAHGQRPQTPSGRQRTKLGP